MISDNYMIKTVHHPSPAVQKQQDMPLSGMRYIYGMHKKQVTVSAISTIMSDSILIANIRGKHWKSSLFLLCLPLGKHRQAN